MLIVFEGIDGAGKATEIAMLRSFLRQHKVKSRLHKYPTKKAKEAFAHLKGEKDVAPERLAGVFADDIISEKKKIEKEIADGFVVICDRYLHSTLAYQGVGVDFELLREKLSAKGAITPDLVVLLDVPAETSAIRKRAQKTPDRFEKDVGFLRKVRNNYLKMGNDGFLSYKYVTVDASAPAERVFSEVITAVEPLVIKKIG